MMPGIIPADAGSTTSEWPSDAAVWDHPRGCGEHSAATSRRLESGGSSPRMRGAHHVCRLVEPAVGIIPADAGSTPAGQSASPRSWDHPRGCGEHPGLHAREVGPAGSSPRMRGAPELTAQLRLQPGIIPADAGSTRCQPGRSGCWRDHPRGCGEHSVLVSYPSAYKGSSPRMRGAHRLHIQQPTIIRIIPTHAGSTPQEEAVCSLHGNHGQPLE